jgi:hypothetical protein
MPLPSRDRGRCWIEIGCGVISVVAHSLQQCVIGVNPFVTPRGAEAKLNIAYNTAMRAIEQLEKLEVLIQVSEARRDRVFCAKAILDILEEPARLTPA